MNMNSKYPEYYIVGERPAKVVETENGGLTCFAYDWKTGEFKQGKPHTLYNCIPILC